MKPNDWFESEFAERRELILRRERFCREFAISRVALEREGSPRIHLILDEERYRFTVSLFGLSHEQRVFLPEYVYPDGWWQAFKERFFPRWARNRWPVRWKKVGGGEWVFDVRALFPEIESLGNDFRIYFYKELRPAPPTRKARRRG